MFISKDEKKYLFDTIRSLESRIEELECSKLLAGITKNDVQEEIENLPPVNEFVEPAKKRTRRPSITPRGSLAMYVYPFVNNLFVGQSVEIPPSGDFTATRIQRSVSSYVLKKFKNGKVLTSILKNGNVYVVRIA